MRADQTPSRSSFTPEQQARIDARAAEIEHQLALGRAWSEGYAEGFAHGRAQGHIEGQRDNEARYHDA